MKITFVILHYMAVEDTQECIDSILNNVDAKDLEIKLVIVDNASPDNSYKTLTDKYGNMKNIYFIHSDENLGFAKGNNLGFEYAKKELDTDFIVMINNDTIIKQRDFCKLIVSEYNSEQFAIAGPNIISLKGSINQNPISYRKPRLKDIYNRILKYKILKVACAFNMDKIIHRLNEILIKKEKNTSEDFKLHGSCLIFSKDYISKYDGLYSETFMYGEEDILKWISIRDNLKMLYLKDISIYHKEDVSTDKLFGNERKKRLFYYKWNIDSLEKLKELMKKG